MIQSQVARCISCRGEVSVPDSYAHGTQIGCGTCSIQLKIVRTGGLRLVVADLIALHEEKRLNRQLIEETSRELQRSRASWGIGVNGLGLGVLYVVAQMVLDERELSQGLLVEAIALAVVTGVLLEVANFLFLAKRSAIARLTDQLQRAMSDQREIERKIRESSRR